MNHASSRIVPDGLQRLLGDVGYRQKQRALETKIRKKYSVELASAGGWWERVAVEDKSREEIKRHRPSLYTLWCSS